MFLSQCFTAALTQYQTTRCHNEMQSFNYFRISNIVTLRYVFISSFPFSILEHTQTMNEWLNKVSEYIPLSTSRFFSETTRTPLGSTQPLIQWLIHALSPGTKAAEDVGANNPHVVSKLSMSGAILLLPYTASWRARGHFYCSTVSIVADFIAHVRTGWSKTSPKTKPTTGLPRRPMTYHTQANKTYPAVTRTFSLPLSRHSSLPCSCAFSGARVLLLYFEYRLLLWGHVLGRRLLNHCTTYVLFIARPMLN